VRQQFLAIDDALWIPVKDGNETALEIFLRHYSASQQRKIRQFIGPGDKMPLLTPDAQALFVWRKFINDGGQLGVNCAVFRNESMEQASTMILNAEHFARERWPGERFYTYVDPLKVRPTMVRGLPCWGFCFYKAGWKYHGLAQNGKHILEK
jgi:hypothetical protein